MERPTRSKRAVRARLATQSPVPRRVESRLAPPKHAERRHARPGAGIKRSRANMSPKSR